MKTAAFLCISIALIVVTVLMLVALPISSFAQEEFVPLQTVGGVIEKGSDQRLGDFLNGVFRIGVGAAALLAVLMITIGGFEYMTSTIPGVKADGKSRIVGAILGLLLILLSWLILNIINPDILSFDLFRS